MTDLALLMQIFDALFLKSFNTKLINGIEHNGLGHEPLYLPAGNGASFARIIFAHGFFASALHEVAHWCLAGRERRQKIDFGYWYAPDGRTANEQKCFEKVEIKPQSLEWIFSKACQKPFRVSVDNLNETLEIDGTFFKESHVLQTYCFLDGGLPERASIFAEALAGQFGGVAYKNKQQYLL